ncbi:MAG: calcium-binding protein [Microcoleaceae cyanobacterium]
MVVILTDGDDIFNQDAPGNIAPETINGLRGDDVISLSTLGGSVANGNEGNDSLVANGPGDTINGDANEDTLVVKSTRAFGFGGVGNDSLVSYLRSYIYGNDGEDTLQGITDANWFNGNADNDLIIGGFVGRDTIYGGKGNDTMTFRTAGGTGGTTLQLIQELNSNSLNTVGSDITIPTSSNQGNNFISADRNDDVVTGAGDRDTMYGGRGNDTLASLGSEARVYGDRGDDKLYGANRITRSVTNVAAVQSVSRLQIWGDNPSLTTSTAGETYNDMIMGPIGPFGDGRNTLAGGLGNDTITGQAARDSILGGDGNDLIETKTPEVASAGVTVTINESSIPLNTVGYTGNNTLDGGLGNDTIKAGNITDQMVGGEGDDCLTGLFTRADGSVGNDTIDASFIGTEAGLAVGASVTLIGGAGNDWLIGTTAPGVFNYFNPGTGNDYVQLATTGDQLIGDMGGDDTLLALENGTAGSLLQDTLGNNTFLGNTLNDTLIGGSGKDTIRGGNGNDSLWGAAGNDQLNGNAGSDSLFAGGGDDYLIGSSGADFLRGGDGKDSFAFFGEAPGTRTDIIGDFNPTDDSILLSKDGYKGVEIAKNNGNFASGNTNPGSAQPFLLYKNGILSYDLDGTGTARPVAIASFDKVNGSFPGVTLNDIIII